MNIFLAEKGKTSPIKIAVNMIIATMLVVGIFWFSMAKIGTTLDFSFVKTMNIRLLDGFLMTIYLSIASLIASLLIGLISAVCHSSKILIFRYLAKIYVTIIRGTPLIMQIYLFYYIVGTAFGVENRFLSGLIILSIFEGAYISEIIRGSILSLDKSQIEVAASLGLSKNQTLKNVILPQLFARTLPALTGQFASIIKDSSLLSIIALIEITQTMREITAVYFNMFEAYIFLGFLYLCLTLPVTFISKTLERRFNYEN